MFPYFFAEANFKPEFGGGELENQEQVVLDLRNEQSKHSVRINETVNTLKQEFDIWNERP